MTTIKRNTKLHVVAEDGERVDRVEAPVFQEALRFLRGFAHRRGLIVASPTRLVGAERTIYGDSDDVDFGPKSYNLISGELKFGGELPANANESAGFALYADALLDMAHRDIKDCVPPESAQVPELEDERDRWDIRGDKRVGTVVRVGEGSTKHYLLYLWDNGWYLVRGQPCYDLPMFGLPDIRERAEAPVMIHEGPKSRLGAASVGNGKFSVGVGNLANWMSLYAHVGWHGSDIGMEWTDWSPLRGRRVLIWPDMDEAGILNARALARKIATMGGVIEYVNWSSDEIENHTGWDWGDEQTPFVKKLTRSAVRARMQKVESPIDNQGKLLDEWMQRSFYDSKRAEVYTISQDYEAVPLSTFVLGLPKNLRDKLVTAPLNPFRGTDFIPGIAQGRMDNGNINLCPSPLREPMRARPLSREIYEAISGGWLRKMVPDPVQRKHLIRRAAWALARPQHTPRHMVVLQGDSGIGKSVFLDLLVRVAGGGRAISLDPETVFGKFNGLLSRKSIVCVPEIHSNDLTSAQNTGKLKELLANETITLEEKNRPRITHKNIIHWFAATNETIPFKLSHGNDRFYFVKCASPSSPREIGRKNRFFNRWVPRFHEEVFLDELYSAAKWVCDIMRPGVAESMTARASRQKSWDGLEALSMRAWEQTLLGYLQELEAVYEGSDSPFLFLGKDMVRLIQRDYKMVGPFTIQKKMNEFGYSVLRGKTGGSVQVRMGPQGGDPKNTSNREVVWCRKGEVDQLVGRTVSQGEIVRRWVPQE